MGVFSTGLLAKLTCDLEQGEELDSGLTGVVHFSVTQCPKPVIICVRVMSNT